METNLEHSRILVTRPSESSKHPLWVNVALYPCTVEEDTPFLLLARFWKSAGGITASIYDPREKCSDQLTAEISN